ncbi:MAG: TetR/AcrR family transcriptional regulator ['Candidatus Kapabacteria' thiocyanatum]|uniref:TetR family transcriptional regulator n=1 Tax=Candidatus Kapaibacterium thiocyanatum TaxID=1895771 RepID=A0A1M3L6H0_9BACT|nr:TetR/AcrR family transcriptional regulator ['Candidatus Kapabacteria' thiocyanatum]OJX61079.1 MAG: TetR family transcriptional regulator ['Candidatus Kapabacteria' thiocyanatum]
MTAGETQQDPTTEERIKEAARKLFLQKGYAGTRTRDIAEQAGINLALLNYYFRSKEKLFELIMTENLQEFGQGVIAVVNDKSTTLGEKFTSIVNRYIDMLERAPEMPVFIFSEIQANPERIGSKIGVKNALTNSFLLQQYKEEVAAGRAAAIHPLHLIMNLLGLTIFPFIGRPLLQYGTGMKQEDFMALMQERRTLIPLWVKAAMETRQS